MLEKLVLGRPPKYLNIFMKLGILSMERYDCVFWLFILALGIFLWAFSAFFSVAIMVTPFEHLYFALIKTVVLGILLKEFVILALSLN